MVVLNVAALDLVSDSKEGVLLTWFDVDLPNVLALNTSIWQTDMDCGVPIRLEALRFISDTDLACSMREQQG